MTDSPSADRPWLSSYGEGVPLDLPPIDGSLMDLLDESARDYPEAPALQFFGRETTYAALHDAVSRAGGQRPRDRRG